MARINIEDQFWLDAMDVLEKVPEHGQDKVLGNAIRFFRFSQEEHKKGNLISEETFKQKGFLEELIPTFAKRTPSGIQAIGAEKHFGWLKQKKEAGSAGGKKSAKRPRDAKGRLLKKDAKTAKKVQAKPNDHQPSYSSSYSPSSSSSDSFEIKNSSNSANPQDSPPKLNEFIAVYCERFKERWGVNPQIGGKETGILKRLVKDLTLGRFKIYVEAYFTMPDAWVVKAKHPLNIFENKLNEVVVFAESGEFTTALQARQMDSSANSMSILKDIREGKV